MSVKTTSVISIIIPTYNRASYIADAIDSVLAQDYSKYEAEILVIDDGSTDNTSEIVARYENKVTYIQLPHSGKPAVPRNHGLSIAQGELIAFQDSDDVWPKDKMAKQLPIFDDKKVMLSYGQALAMKMDGTVTKEHVVEPSILNYGESFETLIQANSISTLTVVARREALNSVGGFNESDELRAVEDYELWLRINAKYPSGIKYINENLAYYRRHDDNISKADDAIATQRIVNVFDSLWSIDYLSNSQRRALEDRIEEIHKNLGHLLSEKLGRPAISVVMGAYNAEKFLRPALESILAQTLHNFEFIIINDGSQDKTVEIIKSYQDSRIRVVNQVNHGLVYSLNKGFRIAAAEFVARMDADDLSLPSRFEKELQAITVNERIGVVGAFFTYIDEISSSPSITITFPTKDIDLKRTLYIVNPFGHGSTLIRKSAWQEAGGYSDAYGPTEDNVLWARIAEKWELSTVPESLYWYRINPNSISHQKQEIQHKFAAQIIEEQWQKPFIRKGFRQTIADGRYYKRMASPYAAHVYHQYLHQQVLIMRRLYKDQHLIAGLRTALPLICLRPKSATGVVRSSVGGLLHRLGIRSYG